MVSPGADLGEERREEEVDRQEPGYAQNTPTPQAKEDLPQTVVAKVDSERETHKKQWSTHTTGKELKLHIYLLALEVTAATTAANAASPFHSMSDPSPSEDSTTLKASTQHSIRTSVPTSPSLLSPDEEEECEVGGEESHELRMTGGHPILHKQRVLSQLWKTTTTTTTEQLEWVFSTIGRWDW